MLAPVAFLTFWIIVAGGSDAGSPALAVLLILLGARFGELFANVILGTRELGWNVHIH